MPKIDAYRMYVPASTNSILQQKNYPINGMQNGDPICEVAMYHSIERQKPYNRILFNSMLVKWGN